ncbi:MAG: hypothetical protein WA979_06640 [Pacificimonas sp.]
MDIAVGPDGPAVIEMNIKPDRNGALRTGFALHKWLESPVGEPRERFRIAAFYY